MESPLWHGRPSYLGVGPLRSEALSQAIAGSLVPPPSTPGQRPQPARNPACLF